MDNISRRLNQLAAPKADHASRVKAKRHLSTSAPIQRFPDSALSPARPTEFEEQPITLPSKTESFRFGHIAYMTAVIAIVSVTGTILWTQSPTEHLPGAISTKYQQPTLGLTSNELASNDETKVNENFTAAVNSANQNSEKQRQHLIPTSDEPLFLQALTPRVLNVETNRKPLISASSNNYSFLGHKTAKDFSSPLLTLTEPMPTVSEPSQSIDLVKPNLLPPQGEARLGFNFRQAPWQYVLSSFASQLKVALYAPEYPNDTLTFSEPTPYSLRDAFVLLREQLARRGFELKYDSQTLSLSRKAAQ